MPSDSGARVVFLLLVLDRYFAQATAPPPLRQSLPILRRGQGENAAEIRPGPAPVTSALVLCASSAESLGPV